MLWEALAHLRANQRLTWGILFDPHEPAGQILICKQLEIRTSCPCSPQLKRSTERTGMRQLAR
jgi:hypothetical protein